MNRSPRQRHLTLNGLGHYDAMDVRLDWTVLCLMVPAMVLYSLAAVSHAWFALPPHSFYGLWSVKFCDVLTCQIIPAVFADEPGWYNILQVLSLVSWAGLTLALFMLLSKHLHKCLPPQLVVHKHRLISLLCIVSAFANSGTLILFYVMLHETSHPQISWSSVLASISCVCELCAGLLLLG